MMDDVQYRQVFLIGGLGFRFRLVEVIRERQEVHARRALPLVHQVETNHHEKLADSGTEVHSGISTNQPRDAAAVFR